MPVIIDKGYYKVFKRTSEEKELDLVKKDNKELLEMNRELLRRLEMLEEKVTGGIENE